MSRELSVQGWRNIVRHAIAAPELADFPYKDKMLLVAYDVATLVDVNGIGPYRSRARKGRSLDTDPIPALCELVEVTHNRVSQCLKLWEALGYMEKGEAAPRTLANYTITLPRGGRADYAEFFAVVAELGIKLGTKRRNTTKAVAHRQARRVLDAAPEADGVRGDVPQDAPDSGYVTTDPTEVRRDVPQRERHDVPPRVRRDVPPLPIGVSETTDSYCDLPATAPRPRPEADEQTPTPIRLPLLSEVPVLTDDEVRERADGIRSHMRHGSAHKPPEPRTAPDAHRDTRDGREALRRAEGAVRDLAVDLRNHRMRCRACWTSQSCPEAQALVEQRNAAARDAMEIAREESA